MLLLILTLFLLLKVTGISEDQLLVTVLSGLPTTAEIFIVPEKRLRPGGTEERWTHLDQVLHPSPRHQLRCYSLCNAVFCDTQNKKTPQSKQRGSQGRAPLWRKHPLENICFTLECHTTIPSYTRGIIQR